MIHRTKSSVNRKSVIDDGGFAGTSFASSKELLSIQDKVDRYGKAKAQNVRITDYLRDMLDQDEYKFPLNLNDRRHGFIRPQIQKVYENMKACASWMNFRYYLDHKKVKLTSSNFCKKRMLCQACAIRRGDQALSAYMDRVKVVMDKNPNLKAWLITFTVKNGEDLHERFHHLKKSFDRLKDNRRKYNSSGEQFRFNELVHIDGAVYSYEVPKSKDGKTWHPHIHLLALCETAPDVGYVDPVTGKGHGLRHEWYKSTGDSFMVDVRRDETKTVEETACEVMKYAVKFAMNEPEDSWIAFRTLRGKRLLGAFGSLYGVKVPESYLDKPLDGAFVEFAFRYLWLAHDSANPQRDLQGQYSLSMRKEHLDDWHTLDAHLPAEPSQTKDLK